MSWPRRGLLLLLALLALAPRAVADPLAAERVQRLAAAERTIELVAARQKEQRARLAARVRRVYERERPGFARLWVEPGSRMAHLARRAAVSRLLRRDLRELGILRAERDAAVAARDRAREEIGSPEPAPPPAAGSLVRPIRGARMRAGFGPRRHRESGADLSARGVELAARPGDEVVAVAGGSVLWTGRLAGGLTAVLVDHASFVSVLVGFARVGVAPGQEVAAGQALGEAAGGALHLEIRLRTGAFGHPIDPAPLLGRRSGG